MIKNIIKYSSGLVIAQIVGFISLPVITRTYSPEEFGSYSLIVQFSILLSILISLRHEQTIILDNNKQIIEFYLKKFERFLNNTFIFLITILILEIYITDNITIISVILSALFLVNIGFLSSKNLYFEYYSKIGLSELVNKVFFSIFVIFSSYIFNYNNLVIGYILGLFSKIVFLRYKDKKINYSKLIDKNNMQSKKAGYSVAVSHMILALVTIIPMLTINKYYNQQILGDYSLAIAVIFLPSTVIGVSIGNIYFEKLSKSKDDFVKIFLNFFYISFLISSFLYLPLYFYSEEIFKIMFGSKWINSGYIASVLCLPAFFGFITGVFDRTCLVYKFNYHGPIWHASRLILTAAICFYAVINNINFNDFVNISAINMIFLYLIDFSMQMYYGKCRKI